MKRTWKNFKLDKNKVYMRLGQAVAYTGFYAIWIGIFFYGFMTATTLN